MRNISVIGQSYFCSQNDIYKYIEKRDYFITKTLFYAECTIKKKENIYTKHALCCVLAK